MNDAFVGPSAADRNFAFVAFKALNFNLYICELKSVCKLENKESSRVPVLGQLGCPHSHGV